MAKFFDQRTGSFKDVKIIKRYEKWGLGYDGELYCLFKSAHSQGDGCLATDCWCPKFSEMIEIVKAFAHLRVLL